MWSWNVEINAEDRRCHLQPANEENKLDDDEETSEPSDEEYATAEEEPDENEEGGVEEEKETEVKLWMGSIAKFNAPRSKIF